MNKPKAATTIAPKSTPVVGRACVEGGRDEGGVITEFSTTGRADEEEEATLLRIDELKLLLCDENDEEEGSEEENENALLRIDELKLLLCDEKDEEEGSEDDDEETERLEALLLVIGTSWQIDSVTVSVVTVPPNAKAMPIHVVFAPTVIPASSMTIPLNVVLAASVVACVGIQKTSHADAPLSETIAPTVDVRAPAALKMNVPLPLSISGPPMFIAPELQYTPGV